MSGEKKYIYAKLGYMETDDMVVVQEGYEHEFPILPRRRAQLERDIIIKDGAVVGGDVFGLRVMVGRRCKILGSIFGRSQARIMDETRVYGFVISSAIECGSRVVVDEGLLGDRVVVGDSSRVGRCIIGRKNVEVGRRCDLGDCIVVCLDGDVRVGAETKVLDILARGNVELGPRVEVAGHSIWALEGSVEHDGTISVGGMPYREEFELTKLRGEQLCSLLDRAFYYCLDMVDLREVELKAREEAKQ